MKPEPQIRVLVPGDEVALEAFLLPRLASSMFLVGNMRTSGLVDRGKPYQGTYAAAFENGTIVSVVAHFWNQVLIFQAPMYIDALWRTAVAHSKREIKGLIGPNDQVLSVQRVLDIDPAYIQLDQKEKLYSLNLDALHVPEALRTGQVRGRRIDTCDLDLLTEWRVGYSLEALGEQDYPGMRADCHASIKRELQDKRTWVAEVDGYPVATSGFNAMIKEAVQIGGVWTPPELRRRGYGRCAVAASLLDARAEGVKQAILFTDEENVPAQKAYTALGFQHIGDYRLVLLNTGVTPK
ncbi:MAG: GNAT family N-acetyltransferase [Anaerolineae bacterium]|nr:GNAT family N-acetyltransferase [Anaerolineae bacterium]